MGNGSDRTGEALAQALAQAYSERAKVAAVVVAMAARLGWRYGWLVDSEEPEWPVVLVDLPTGQVSWHFSATDFTGCFPGGLPSYPGEWDGHDTAEKYRRCAALSALPEETDGERVIRHEDGSPHESHRWERGTEVGTAPPVGHRLWTCVGCGVDIEDDEALVACRTRLRSPAPRNDDDIHHREHVAALPDSPADDPGAAHESTPDSDVGRVDDLSAPAPQSGDVEEARRWTIYGDGIEGWFAWNGHTRTRIDLVSRGSFSEAVDAFEHKIGPYYPSRSPAPQDVVERVRAVERVIRQRAADCEERAKAVLGNNHRAADRQRLHYRGQRYAHERDADTLAALSSDISDCALSPAPDGKRSPAPALGEDVERRRSWVCEFCFKPADGDLPNTWRLVWQSAVCPECHVQVERDGGYGVVKGGAYAYAKDPRALSPAPGVPSGETKEGER